MDRLNALKKFYEKTGKTILELIIDYQLSSIDDMKLNFIDCYIENNTYYVNVYDEISKRNLKLFVNDRLDLELYTPQRK